jgi:hypothetical protein
MSVFAPGAPQISATETRDSRSQFRARNTLRFVRFVSFDGPETKWRGAIVRTGFAL